MGEDTTKPTPEAEVQRAPGLAVVSLVCGITGLCLLRSFVVLVPSMALPAIVCGHWARYQIRKNPRRYGGSWLALTGLILGYLPLALIVSDSFLGGTDHHIGERALRINCAANLKQIGLACNMYASDYNGAFPPNWKILWDMKYLDAGKIYICPATKSKPATDSAQFIDPRHRDYVYFGAGQTDIGPTGATTVLAADRTGNHRGYMNTGDKCGYWNVVFEDSHVEGLTAAPGTDFATAVRAKGWILPGAAKRP